MSRQKIVDLDKSQQTDQIKVEVLDMIKQFTFKYRNYYPSFRGSFNELCWELYIGFLKPKDHRNGEKYSELDRFDPGEMGGEDWKGTLGETMKKKLAAYVQRYVVHRLIDLERSSKKFVTYDENFDVPNTIPLDLIASDIPDEDDDWAITSGLMAKGEDLEDIVFTEAQKQKARTVYANMSNERKLNFLKTYEQIKNNPQTPQNLKTFFEEIVGNDTYRGFARRINSPKQSKSTSDVVDQIKEDIIKATHASRVDSYKLQGKEAVRILFDNPVEHNNPDVDNALQELGYTFYTARPKAWYYLKEFNL